MESSELINQSLFYLNWIVDHKGDFEIAVQKRLGNGVAVDFSDVRVICIAPNFRKYDLHAVQVMGANIELWSYRLFENSTLYLEQIYGKSFGAATALDNGGKNPVMVAAGKKAAATRATGFYTFDEHIEGKSEGIRDLAITIQEHILGLDPTVAENPKKLYVAYKTSQNIACMEVKQKRIVLYLKLEPKTLGKLPPIARDVTEIGHYGTGDLEVSIKNEADFEAAIPFIEMAYKRVGG